MKLVLSLIALSLGFQLTAVHAESVSPATRVMAHDEIYAYLVATRQTISTEASQGILDCKDISFFLDLSAEAVREVEVGTNAITFHLVTPTPIEKSDVTWIKIGLTKDGNAVISLVFGQSYFTDINEGTMLKPIIVNRLATKDIAKYCALRNPNQYAESAP